MLNYLPLVILLFNAAEAVQPKPVYYPSHFIYYTDQGSPKPLVVANKVFIELDNNKEKSEFINLLEAEFKWYSTTKVKNIKNRDFNGKLCEFDSKEETLMFLNKLPFYTNNRKYYPVVMWEGTEAVVLPEVVFKVKPFLVYGEIYKRLENITGLKIRNIGSYGHDVFHTDFSEFKTNLNIFVIANLIATDAWIEWCQPSFMPLHGKINGTAYITSPAKTNLGEERVLHLVVSIYDNEIKLREDLLPYSFLPWPTPEDHWFDAGARTIKKTKDEHKTIYEISYPFRHLDVGNAMFADLFVSYEQDSKVYTVKIENVYYEIVSVIEGTNINEMQPVVSTSKLPSFELFELDDYYLKLCTYLKYCSMVFILSGLIFCSFPILAYIDETRRKRKLAYQINLEKMQVWNDLLTEVNTLSFFEKPKGWQDSYTKIYSKFRSILINQYEINASVIDNKLTEDATVNSILLELEKAFQKDTAPDTRYLYNQLVILCKNV